MPRAPLFVALAALSASLPAFSSPSSAPSPAAIRSSAAGGASPFAFVAPKATALGDSLKRKTASVEHVLLETEDKVEVSGKFYLPKGKDRVPAVIIVHEPGGNGEDLKELAESLQKRGLAVLVPDLRGHGTSVREDMDWNKLDEEGQSRLWAFAARDVEACAEWLRARRDVHTSNLTMIGILGGSTLAAHHAVGDENARAVVLISPQAEELGFNVLGDLRELGGLPTLVIAEKAADESCKRMSEAGHKANGGSEYIEVKVLKSERTELLGHRKLKGEITGWLREQVMPRRGK